MNKKKIPFIPEKIVNYELKEIKKKKTSDTTYVLKNINFDVYLVLCEHDYFIWNIIDGKHSLEDINLAFYKNYNKLAIEYIEKFIKDLGNKGFILNYEFDESNLKYKQKITEFRFPLKHVEKNFTFLYKILGKILLCKCAILLYILISIIGIIFYFSSTQNSVYIIQNIHNMVLLYVLVFASVFIHECSHALVCIKYGRKVKDAGFMLYMFMPVFYVNTSDIWMENKKARIAVSLAGPCCDVFIGSLCIILNVIFIENSISSIFYQIALLAYVRVALNLNPLLKWDGYYCLMDIMEVYNLKEKSIKFVKDIHKRLKKKQRFNHTEVCLLVYGVLSTLYIIYFMLKLLFSNFSFWRSFNGSGLNIQVFTNIIIVVPIIVFIYKLLINTGKNIFIKIKKYVFKKEVSSLTKL